MTFKTKTKTIAFVIANFFFHQHPRVFQERKLISENNPAFFKKHFLEKGKYFFLNNKIIASTN
jgi:hypothetical protein